MLPTHTRDSVAPEEKAGLAAAAKSFTEHGPMSPQSSEFMGSFSNEGGGAGLAYTATGVDPRASVSHDGGEPPFEIVRHVPGNKVGDAK